MAPKIDPSAATAATVALGQTVAAFTFFLPRLQEVRQASVEDGLTRGDVRLGQTAASILAVTVGVMMAQITGSVVPVAVSGVAAAVIVAIYEVAMNTEGLFE